MPALIKQIVWGLNFFDPVSFLETKSGFSSQNS